MTRRTGLTAAAIFLLATLLLQVPVDAATGPYKVHHFNMWARRHESTGGLNPATYAKNIIGTSKPMILTYNEICKSQYDTLASHLGSGYSKHFQTVVDDPPSCGSNEDFGIAIFIQGSWQEALSGIYNDQAAGDEVRRYYCIRTTFYAVPLVGCVTHLTNKSDPTASKQAGQLAYRMGLYWGSLYHFAGGDFNMTPTYMRGRTDGAQYWHQQYHESDRTQERFTHDCRATLDQKVDYIFGSNNNTSVASAATLYACAPATSDHKYMIGHYYLN